MDRFVEIEWNTRALERFELPNVGYPVPIDVLEQVLQADGNVDFTYMLYWCQEFCSTEPDKWPGLELAMRRVAELIAAPDKSTVATVEGDFWALRAGEVNLESLIITIQRHDDLVAAVMPYEDGTLVWSVYRPLDALSTQKIINLSRRPHPEYGVQMRENNWEFALDASAHTTSALYASEKGQAYLSRWDHGLGVNGDKTIDENYWGQRHFAPMPANQVAAQLGVYYQLCSDDVFG